MTIEYVPPNLRYVNARRLEKREADIVCLQCGVLGGGTLSTPRAMEEAEIHDSEHPDHTITITQIQCGFGMW